MKHKKTIITILAAAGVAAVTQAQPVLYYGFGSDAEGFSSVTHSNGPSGWGGGPTVQQNHGAGGWQMLMTKEFSWGPGGGSANQQTDMQALTFYSDPKIDFDIMVDGTSFPAGAATWFQFWIVGNSDGAAGWTQSQLVDAYQNADQSDLRVWHFSRTFADLGWEPGDTWFQFWTGANSDGAVPVEWYIDNVVVYDTVVPEPSTIALAGLGSLLLLFRRRH